jgi:hypothetical protein
MDDVIGWKSFVENKDHLLANHLNDVGQRATEFSSAFDAQVYGYIASSPHDLGKAEEESKICLQSNDTEGEKQPHQVGA